MGPSGGKLIFALEGARQTITSLSGWPVHETLFGVEVVDVHRIVEVPLGAFLSAC